MANQNEIKSKNEAAFRAADVAVMQPAAPVVIKPPSALALPPMEIVGIVLTTDQTILGYGCSRYVEADPRKGIVATMHPWGVLLSTSLLASNHEAIVFPAATVAQIRVKVPAATPTK